MIPTRIIPQPLNPINIDLFNYFKSLTYKISHNVTTHAKIILKNGDFGGIFWRYYSKFYEKSSKIPPKSSFFKIILALVIKLELIL